MCLRICSCEFWSSIYLSGAFLRLKVGPTVGSSQLCSVSPGVTVKIIANSLPHTLNSQQTLKQLLNRLYNTRSDLMNACIFSMDDSYLNSSSTHNVISIQFVCTYWYFKLFQICNLVMTRSVAK